jgi:hypothetical protein
MATPPLHKKLVRGLGSLHLTVYLLLFSLLLVFFGTLDQVRIGIREAQILYFESVFVIWRYPEFWPMGDALKWIPVPLPGGYLLGPLLFVNLLVSHISHFRKSWSFYGISFIHAGILTLLVGQLISNLYQKDNYMWLDEGAKANFIQSFREDELYLTRTNTDGTMGVYAIPFEDIREGRLVAPPNFPFSIRVKRAFHNTEIKQGGESMGLSSQGVTHGLGVQLKLGFREIESFHSDDQRDIRSAVVEVLENGEPQSTWLVSNVFPERFPEQTFQVDGVQYAIGLRFKKTYLPFTVTLLDFNHDRYPGTNIPSNFSSRVHVAHQNGDEKDVMVFMNNPLRYEGYTFFQASFAKQDTASMFHVVRNPGWLLPYIACLLVTIGLVWQFTVVGQRMVRRINK